MAVKKLGDLTVEEATKELKKRGLDVNGDRNILITRLRKALTEERKPQSAASASTGSNQTEEMQPPNSIDKAAPVAGAEAKIQTPTSSGQTESSSESIQAEEKPPEAEVDHSDEQQHDMIEEGGECSSPPAGKEKGVDDPLFDLMADESQNDLDDDIVCVSVTPGRGLPMGESSGQKQVQKNSAVKTTPPKDSNICSTSEGNSSERDGSKTDLSLWISGLTSTARAADLKTMFNNYGKVTGAKVVASAKSPGSKCFGIVTMATADDVERCIKELNGSSLQGKTITVELYSGHRKTVEKAMVTPETSTLWVTGIAPDTKAPELKKLFVPYGRVIAATIVMSTSGRTLKRCGLVKMSSCEEADLCIQKVNKMNCNGRIVTVERAKSNTMPTAKYPGKVVNRQPPALMSQKVPGNKPPGSKPLSLLDPLLPVKGNMPKPARESERGRFRRGQGVRMGRRGSNIPPPGQMRMEREHEMQRLQQERELKAKEAELVRVLSLEYDRQKQKEEADRLAYEREQLEIEKMRLERVRIESERMRVQLEQQRRQNEREQLERERARNQMLRNEQKMNMKRAAEQEDSYWNYLAKRNRASNSPPSSSQSLSRGPGFYENTNQRLQQMAHGADRRLGDSRMKDSIPSGSGSSMGGRQMPMSSMYRPSSGLDSGESGSKSEWKSLFNMSSGGSGNNGGEQSQWKSLSASSMGRSFNDHPFASSSSYRDRSYPGDNSGFGGMKSQYGTGFKGGRGGGGAGSGAHRWR